MSKYVIHVEGYGYYSGQNGNYYDMFNTNALKFAKVFNEDEANKLAENLRHADYEVEIIEHNEMSYEDALKIIDRLSEETDINLMGITYDALDKAKKAIMLQLPVEPVKLVGGGAWRCPKCKQKVSDQNSYCDCGQHINWNDTTSQK